MRKLGLLVASATLIALQVPSARATTFDWSYSDGGLNVGGGTLTADPTAAPDTFSVTSISGIANGETITGLDGSFDFPDNLVFSPSPPDIALDTNGISFDVAGGAFSLYEDDGIFNTDSPFSCGGVYCLIGAGDPVVVDVTLTPVAAVGEPAALSLLAVGLGGLGVMARRRRRQGSAIAAA